MLQLADSALLVLDLGHRAVVLQHGLLQVAQLRLVKLDSKLPDDVLDVLHCPTPF
nr:MAG: hypothetical protein [Bacteriophage sp.]